MNISKRNLRPIPNPKIFHEPANSPVTSHIWTREAIEKHLKGAGG